MYGREQRRGKLGFELGPSKLRLTGMIQVGQVVILMQLGIGEKERNEWDRYSMKEGRDGRGGWVSNWDQIN